MKRKGLFLLFLIFPLLLTACSNPKGGFGPSWDITAKIPIIKGNEDNKLTVDLEKGISITLADEDTTLYDLGAELNTVSIKQNIVTVPLLNNSLDFDPELGEFEKVSFNTPFSSIELGENQADVRIVPAESAVKIDYIELHIFENGNQKQGYSVYIQEDGTGQWIIEQGWPLEISSTGIFIVAVAPHMDKDDIKDVTVEIKLPEKLFVESITCDVGKYLEVENKDAEINFEVDLDLVEKERGELAKVDFNPKLYINLVTKKGLNIDIENIAVTTVEEKPKVINAKLDSIDDTGLKKHIEFEGDKDIRDLLLDPEVKGLKVTGKYSITSEEDITVDRNSKVGIESIEIKVPYVFTIKEDMEFQRKVEKLGSIDKETRDILKSDLGAALVIEDLHNDFPFSLTMEIYLASIPGNKTEEELEDILYRRENIFKEVSIEQRQKYSKPFTVGLNSDELEIFFKQDLYAGIKYIIPENTYTLTPDDELTFGRIYISLTGRINN